MRSTASSEPFIADRSAIFRQVVADPRQSWGLWLLTAVSLSCLIAGIIASLVLTVFGLLLLFGAIPMAAHLLYLGRLTAPDLVINSIPHTIEESPSGWKITIFRKAETDDGDGTKKTELIPHRTIHISKECVRKKTLGFDYDILHLKDSTLSLLYLPK